MRMLSNWAKNDSKLHQLCQMREDVRSAFLETNEFIDSLLKEECEKEKMTVDEVIFCF